MFLGRRHARRHATKRCLVAAATLCLAGCGGEPDADIRVGLLAPEGQALLDALTSITLYAERDDQRLALVRAPYEPGTHLDLAPLPARRGLVITAAGTGDAGEPVAHGSVEPALDEDGGRCCVTLCFCSEAAHAAGTCTCNEARCDCP